jgi:hypothetical protein
MDNSVTQATLRERITTKMLRSDLVLPSYKTQIEVNAYIESRVLRQKDRGTH